MQRCVRHKERNVLAHLPERDRPPCAAGYAPPGRWMITTAPSSSCAAWPTSSPAPTPGAAASLREGMHETLTVTRLGVRGRLKRTRLHEPVRVDDRDRPQGRAQRQALAIR